MRTRSIISVVFVILATLAAAGHAFAHAKLQSSKPADREVLETSPDRIELEFSVGVQPRMSSLILREANGRQIDLGTPESSADRKRVWVITPALIPGEYKVLWRALSSDDHMIDGEFAFLIGPAAAVSIPEPGPPAAEHDHSLMDHNGRSKDEIVNWPQSVVRWLMYVAMMLITGGLFFRLFVVDRMEPEAVSVHDFDRRAGTLFITAISVLAGTLLASLALQTLAVFETINLPSMYSVLAETTFGLTWMLQFAGTIALGVLLTKARGRTEHAWVFWTALVVSLILMLAPSSTGHARAAAAEYSLAIPFDWLHLAAASVWVGGLAMILFCAPKLFLPGEQSSHSEALTELIRRFNTLAIPATVLLALTGVYNSWIHVESLSALTGTIYGKVLLTKIAVTSVMIALGAINAFVLRPRIAAARTDQGLGAGRNFFRSVSLEVLLAAVVLLLAAILAFLPPARGHDPAGGMAAAYKQISERNG